MLFVVVGAFLPLVRSAHWWIRIFDFPRLQLVFLGGFALAWLLWSPQDRLTNVAEALVLCAAMLRLMFRMIPYTRLHRTQSKAAGAGVTAPRIRLFVANVWMPNKNYSGLLQIIDRADPDVILLLETDEHWAGGVAGLAREYPHQLHRILDNTYGLMLFSRLPLIDAQLRYWVEDSTPSIVTDLELSTECRLRLFGLHPRPPQPFSDTYERDAELLIVGAEVRKTDKPCIVIGDMNDTAWSHTTRLFQRISGLLDPRIGRGFYNTFHARVPFLRWPLDHVFHAAGFKLVALKRLAGFGSDHFPMYAELCWLPDHRDTQIEPQADSSDEKEATMRVRDGHASASDET